MFCQAKTLGKQTMRNRIDCKELRSTIRFCSQMTSFAKFCSVFLPWKSRCGKIYCLCGSFPRSENPQKWFAICGKGHMYHPTCSAPCPHWVCGEVGCFWTQLTSKNVWGVRLWNFRQMVKQSKHFGLGRLLSSFMRIRSLVSGRLLGIKFSGKLWWQPSQKRWRCLQIWKKKPTVGWRYWRKVRKVNRNCLYQETTWFK